MILKNKNIGFIGAGNMGEAMISALIKSEIFEPDHIYASDINKERILFLENTYKIKIEQDNNILFSCSDIIILAVKPQTMDKVLSKISDNSEIVKDRKLIISIAAGFTIKKIEEIVYKNLNEFNRQNLPIIRVMPNTPALVLSGVSGMSSNKFVQREDIYCAKTILESMGIVIEFEENQIDAVTALSGSGPAYVFFLAESMIEAGISIGFEPKDSVMLTMATIKGALKLMEEKNESPKFLREKVTSKGGTTEAAFKILETNNVKQIIIEAIEAAFKRSKDLSR